MQTPMTTHHLIESIERESKRHLGQSGRSPMHGLVYGLIIGAVLWILFWYAVYYAALWLT